jgi:hypothetical protein
MQVIATRWSHAFFLHMTNGLKPGAHREPIKAGQRQVDERADPALQELEGAHEGLLVSGVLNPPYVRMSEGRD